MAGCRCNGKKSIPTPPQALRLVFDDIANVSSLVADINSVSDWNTFFDLPNLGGAFTSVEIDGNEVKLYGGSNIKVKPALFYNVYNEHNLSLLEIDDQAKCITSVGGDAFSYCYYLTDVNLPECTIVYGWEDSPQNDYGGFGECTSLVSLNIPKLVTAGNYAFFYCTALATINLPNLATAGNNCFYNFESLTEVNLPNLTTAGDYCFNYCMLLETINLPNLTTTGYSCFAQCPSLQSVYFNNLTTAGDECFSDCNNLNTISANNLITAGDSCFYYCTSLLSLNLPNLTTAAYNCFNYCTSLTTINLPNLATAGNFCFSDCTALTIITLPSCTNLGTTTGDGNVFQSISGNTITLTIPSALMTCNGGNPDGDIQYLQSNNTVTITTV